VSAASGASSGFKRGQLVRYHPLIGGEHDGNLYEVQELGAIGGQAVASTTETSKP